MRLMGLGGIAAVATVAAGAFMAPAYGRTAMVPGSGGGMVDPPVTRSADPAMSSRADPAMAMSSAGDAALVGQLAAARLATAKYATDLGRARAGGYQIITKMMPNMGFHFMNPAIQGFDVRKPQILVYEHTGGHTWQLGALEWVFTKMPATVPLPDATFGSFPAACHYKDGTFVADENSKTCPKTAPHTGAAFNFWHPDLITMHVWAWYPNPAGLYSSTNPLVAPFNGG
jgi:hypothetical protein